MTQTSVDSPTDLLRNADVVTHPSAIIDIYESVTGVQWSPTQRRRAASGEHVLRLIMFSQTELLQAAEAQRDAAIFDWTRWRNDAIAVRNRDIKFD